MTFHICAVFHQMISLDDATVKWGFDIFHVYNRDIIDVIGPLFYLLKKIININTTFLLFLTFLIPDFFYYFYFLDFLGIYTFYMPVALQDFPDTLLLDV